MQQHIVVDTGQFCALGELATHMLSPPFPLVQSSVRILHCCTLAVTGGEDRGVTWDQDRSSNNTRQHTTIQP